MKPASVGPLGELFRDEMGKLGMKLELPNEMIYRGHFANPGVWFGIS
ncbi:MAG: hypothetical protein JAY91_03655 [Candidatus Thiodiazotropha endolucinida]|nr:hypothetical protein [Candidatus Thiodiazotropha taylori]MCW4239973.1 hypothetical protein [Candidatus Thiodiazotropha taylori]